MRKIFATVAFLLCFVSLPSGQAESAFPQARGDYGGIIEADDSVSGAEAAEASGELRIALLDSGVSSARLVWRNQIYAFRARFIPDAPGDQVYGTFSGTLPKKGLEAGASPEKLILELHLTADLRTISGTIAEDSGSGSVGPAVSFVLSGAVADTLVLKQLEPGTQVSFIDPPTAVNAAMEGGSPEPAEPASGDGFAVISLGKSDKRNARFVGRLPDNELYSSGSPLRRDSYVVRSPLYKAARKSPGGQILGTATASSGSSSLHETRGITGSVANLIAGLRWAKQKQSKKTPVYNAYANGFDFRLQLGGLPYRFPPGASRRVVPIGLNTTGPRSLANATIILRDGNLAAPVKVPVNYTIFGIRVLSPNPLSVRLNVDPLRGRFEGNFKHPSLPPGAPRVKFSGAFQAKLGLTPGEGRGNFLSVLSRDDPSQSRAGTVRMAVGYTP